ncbi:cytochrome c550 [Evansella caseinilytica]|uniref:Cytochrome c550 n=1 Tax=Evansella caseinilytica TaxID=1503961 RepID=A0A1H3KKF2_9BACI|nr:cytochrome c [Evansella caseinilytica]SDY52556.1 cytochrome c550 [Evansella caseinilytica]
MRGKPLYPFAVTAVLGIGLIIILSFYGLNTGPDMAGDDEADDSEQQFDDPIELGEHVYLQNCSACHGQNLNDGSAPALNALEGKYTAEDIVHIINEGQGAMPAGMASGAEADAVAEYLLSVSE